MHPLDEEEKDEGIYFDPEGVKIRLRRPRRPKPVQFSLWTLLIVVTVICLIGAAIRGGLELVMYGACVTTFICGFIFFGVLMYRLLEAVFQRSAAKTKSLARMVLDGLLGAALVFSLLVLGSWIYAEITHETRLQIDRRYIELRDAMVQDDFAAGYAIMSPTWRKHHTLGQFENEQELRPLEPGRTLILFGDDAWLHPRSQRFVGMRGGRATHWRRIDGQWYYTGAEELID